MTSRPFPLGRAAAESQKIVVLGGGHGLAVSLSALRRLSVGLTGIVTVADNGGSSGRIRSELGGLPPGDLRMALAALCGDDEWGRTWADVLQHRFHGDGPLSGHAVGNLLIAGIWDLQGDHVAGLDLVGQLLGAQGRVLPMAAIPLSIEADVQLPGSPDVLSRVSGQAEVASTDGHVVSVRLKPNNPPACAEAVAAVDAADWIVIGPGSWFTSVLPNLLVPGLRDSLVRTAAKRILVLNLGEQAGETSGFTPADHLAVLTAHTPELRFDYVLVDCGMVDDAGILAAAAHSVGAKLIDQDISAGPGTFTHDPLRLASAFHFIMGLA